MLLTLKCKAAKDTGPAVNYELLMLYSDGVFFELFFFSVFIEYIYAECSEPVSITAQ
jgi:hypothetical protein